MNTKTMTYEKITETKNANKAKLLDFFNRSGLPLERIKDRFIFNGGNCKVECLFLQCENLEEFDRYQLIFWSGMNFGGDYLKTSREFLELYLTIEDGFN
jgi:hypothetical protein